MKKPKRPKLPKSALPKLHAKKPKKLKTYKSLLPKPPHFKRPTKAQIAATIGLLLVLLLPGAAHAQTLVTGTFKTPGNQTPLAAGLRQLSIIGSTHAVYGTADFIPYDESGNEPSSIVCNGTTYVPSTVHGWIAGDGTLLDNSGDTGVTLIPTVGCNPPGVVYRATIYFAGTADGRIPSVTWTEDKALPQTTPTDWGSLAAAAIGQPAYGYVTVESAGVALAQRAILNFPSGVSCVDNPSTLATDCTGNGGGGSGTPGGSNTQVQLNINGAFGGSANFTYSDGMLSLINGGSGSSAAVANIRGNGLGSFTPAGSPALLNIEQASGSDFGLIITNQNAVGGHSALSDLHFTVDNGGIATIASGNLAGDGNGNYNIITFDTEGIHFSSSVPNGISGKGYYFDNPLYVQGSTAEVTGNKNVANGYAGLNGSGLVDVVRGGTGLATLVAHQLYVGNGTSTPNAVAPGTNGQILESAGPDADPAFQDPIVSGPDARAAAQTKNPVAGLAGVDYTTNCASGPCVQEAKVDNAGNVYVSVSALPSIVGTVAATQSGTWTVQAAESGAWTVGLTGALPAGSNVIGGVTIADGSLATLGAKADAKSTATDTTAISIMQVLKEISAMEQAPASRAVTGTLTVQQSTGTNLHIVCDSGCGAAAGFADNSAFTVGTSIINPIGALYTTSTPAITSGNGGRLRMDANSYLLADIAVLPALPAGSNVIGGVTIADGGSTTLGSKADAANTATNTTAITIMQVLKEISAMEQAPASRAVTNGGTFAVQATEAGTWTDGADMPGTVPGTAPSYTAIIGGKYNSSAPSPTNGQTLPFQLDGSGRLIVSCGSGCGGSGGTSLADEASFAFGSSSITPIGGVYNSSITNLTSGQAGIVALTNDRTMMVTARMQTWNGSTWVSAQSWGADNSAFTAGTTPVGILGGWYATSPTACTSGSYCAPSMTSDRKLFVQAFQGTSPWAISIADGGDTTLGSKADAANTATNTTAITIMQVLKEISAMEQTPASRAVTNAGTFAVQAAESGTWTVGLSGAIPAGSNTIGGVTIADGGSTTLGSKADAANTATNTTAISIMQVLKEISAMEQVPASRAVTNAGTFAVQAAESGTWTVGLSGAIPAGSNTIGGVTIADGGSTTLGSKADAANTATNTTAISIMQVLKEISAMEQAPASRAVTNGGTFEVQPDGTTATTTNAASRCVLASAASTNATNCKGSAGNVYGYRFVNTTTTVYYLRMYNSSTSPTCSSATGFVESIPIPPGGASGQAGGIVSMEPFGEGYSTGISFCFTGGSSSTDNTNAATGVFGAVLYR